MKKPIALLVSFLWLFAAVGCSDNGLSKPTTNLEFWIAENVDNVDFSQHQAKYGLMGGYEYYGLGYTPTLDENGEQIDPEHCVVYTITNYPDYASKNLHITNIYVSDPAVEFYGLTVTSTFEEFSVEMEKQGFEIKSESTYIQATKNKYTFTKYGDCINIGVYVSNVTGIEF